MKADRQKSYIATIILNLDTRRKKVFSFTSRPLFFGESTAITMEEEAAYARGSGWKFWRRGKSLIPTGIRSLNHSARKLVAICTPRLMLYVTVHSHCLEWLESHNTLVAYLQYMFLTNSESLG